MVTAVAYYSRTGNTKKVAQSIAEAAGCTAESIASYESHEPVDLLFIGGALYGAKLDPLLVQFIHSLDSGRIRKAAVFCTYFGSDKAIALTKKLLENQGIPLEDNSFACKGRFLFFNRRHPSGTELEEAKRFAASLITE